jgi:hypothetical protein
MGDSLIGRAAPAVLMIRPAGFGFNAGTAETNLFQTRLDDTDPYTFQEKALAEFDRLRDAIRSSGVEVIVIEDRPEPRTPDAVFPNNWVSFHADGTVVLYPMCAPSRHLERRENLVPIVKESSGYRVTRVVDLTHHEEDDRFFEGTGRIVFDYFDRCAYANVSARTHPGLVDELVAVLGYDTVVFHVRIGKGTTSITRTLS